MGVFEKFLGPGFLEWPKALLIQEQMVFPISRHRFDFHGGHCFNCTYLGNWALVVIIISSKFLLDFRPFLLKAIGANILGLLFF